MIRALVLLIAAMGTAGATGPASTDFTLNTTCPPGFEKTSAGVDGSWQDNKGQTPNTMRQFAIWASRELSPFWVTRLSIAYKQRQQDGRPDASANILGVTLIYSHPDF